MRVTQNMLSNQMLRNLSNNYDKLNKYMEQLHTGKKITRPSEDPVVAMKGMGYRSEVSKIEQYKNNVGEAQNWMDNSDEALDKMSKALERLYDLSVQGSTDSYSEKERINMAKEAEQLKEHLKDIANTKVGGKYIFNGIQTDQSPIEKENRNNDSVFIEVASGTKLQVNVLPEDILDEDNSGLFATVEDFIHALNDNERDNIEKSIGELQAQMDNVVNARADLGARMNRLDLIEDRLGHQEIVAKKMMSNNEDIDYEVVITQLITQESILRASLSAGSRTIQPTLLDFLR